MNTYPWWVIHIDESPLSSTPPSLARYDLGRGTVWQCECGKRWMVNKYVDSPVWMRRFLPWPR